MSYLEKLNEHYNDNFGITLNICKSLQSKIQFGEYESNHIDKNVKSLSSLGIGLVSVRSSIELHVLVDDRSNKLEMLRLLKYACAYHIEGASFDIGHIINFGRPIQISSSMQRALISRPYHSDPSLEYFKYGSINVKCLWLLPIHESERIYAMNFGLDALERIFEDKGIEFLDPHRSAVV